VVAYPAQARGRVIQNRVLQNRGRQESTFQDRSIQDRNNAGDRTFRFLELQRLNIPLSCESFH
jgi:hypothetical protein